MTKGSVYTAQHAFTLIELIIVIVLMSIMAAGSVQFISYSALGYVDTARRAELASTATIINEKMSRIIRDALPGSIRVTADNRCVEIIPILASSFYTLAPFTDSASTVNRNEVRVININGELAQTGFLAINPISSNINAAYRRNATSPVSGYVSEMMATIDSLGTVDPDLSDDQSYYRFNAGTLFEFLQPSPQKRVFVVDNPRAFCQSGTRLFYYRNYGFIQDIANLQAGLPTAQPNRLLIADRLLNDSLVFSFTQPSLQRNSIVAYQLTLSDDTQASEILQINQEIHIRNVP